MANHLARVSTSNDNIIQLDRVRPGSSGRGSADRNLCPDLCPDFSTSPAPRKAGKSRKRELTPALIDDLRRGKLDDAKTGALSIEVLSSGKKRWHYRRRITGRREVVKLSLGLYPAYSIADAREWANGLNLQIDAGIDPRETASQELRLATMTVDRAHELYIEAVREGRSSRAKRPNKPRTLADKKEIYRRDIAPKLGRKIIYDVTEADLIKLVEAKGKKARVRVTASAIRCPKQVESKTDLLVRSGDQVCRKYLLPDASQVSHESSQFHIRAFDSGCTFRNVIARRGRGL